MLKIHEICKITNKRTLQSYLCLVIRLAISGQSRHLELSALGFPSKVVNSTGQNNVFCKLHDH